MDRASAAPLRPRYQRFDDDEQGLLQFARHLLEGTAVLPLERGSARLHRDTADRLATLLARGVLHAVIQRGGWHRARFAGRERLAEGRIWDTRELAALNPQVGEASLSLFVELYDLLSGRLDAPLAPERLLRTRRCLEDLAHGGSAWERLLLHVVTEPLVRVGAPAALLELLCAQNGLNQWVFGALPGLSLGLDRAMVGAALDEWGWMLPWTRRRVSAWWARAEGLKLAAGLEQLVAVSGALRGLVSATTEYAIAQGRGELALPVIDFYRALHRVERDPGEATEHLDAMLEALPHSDRQVYRDAWSGFLRPMATLAAWVERLRRVHPVDRTSGELLALAAWDGSDGAAIMSRVDGLRMRLERVVG